MRYLKIFEEYDEPGYSSISQTQYEEEIYGGILDEVEEMAMMFIEEHRQQFTLTEFNKIKRIMPQLQIGSGYSTMELQGYANLDDDESFLTITKMSDEWYYVSSNDYDKFYKCDQLDGLLELLTKLRK